MNVNCLTDKAVLNPNRNEQEEINLNNLKINTSNNQQVFNKSPFCMSPQYSSVTQQLPKCNYSFLRENSYSLMKFLNAGDAPTLPPSPSFYDQPLSSNRFFPTTSMYQQTNQIKREPSASIIKPAKLTITESCQPLILKNELTTNWRDSQDSGLGKKHISFKQFQ